MRNRQFQRAFDIFQPKLKYIDGLSPIELGNFKPVNKSDPSEGVGPIAYWDYTLIGLTPYQRTTLTITVSVLMSLAICGNVATIFVNLNRKKIKPLFKISLISLAISDLLISIFLSTSYISQFSDEMTMLWNLGEILCSSIPFITTLAILVNSMTLVGIAIDRYISIDRVIKWEPGSVFVITCCVLVWGVSAGISSPMMSSYFLFEIYIIISDPHNRSNPIDLKLCEICIGEKIENAYYFGILFLIVFLPLVLAFIWLNVTIAKEIYYRRQPITNHKNNYKNNNNIYNNQEKISIDKQATTVTNTESEGKVKVEINTPKLRTTHKNMQSEDYRRIRQLRMFKVIICIIFVFLLLRLPAWIFLLIKLNTTLTENIHWILHFTFGILSLLNCVINPFIYTFLSETINCSTIFTKKIQNLFSCGKFLMICIRNTTDEDDFKNLSASVSSGINNQQQQNENSIRKNYKPEIPLRENIKNGIFSVS